MYVSIGRWDNLLYGTSRKSRVHFFKPLFSQTVSRSCGIEGGWSKSLDLLLLN
jgi:hypothetical protein